MWQASYRGAFDFKEVNEPPLCLQIKDEDMNNIKFVVKVNRRGTRAPEYVKRVDSTPVQMTTNRKLALLMGRFTAEDAVKSLEGSRCTPELVSVQVGTEGLQI